jgi:neurotransmitter:Na+ symporter, NSS family
MKRERWSSRTIFLFASIGSAVGLGNVWRFPYLAGKYGGGAFLIPYFLMLVILGVPLLILEFAIGQKMQMGAIGSFKKIHSKVSGVGFAAILCGFIISSYYCVVMAWSVIYLVASPKIAWGTNPESFFLEKVLHLSSSAGQTGHTVVPILFALVLVWVLIYFSIWKGVLSVSKVVSITMPLPIILIIILVIRGMTLPQMGQGLSYYLTPSLETLFSKEMWIDVWTAAASQIFFTLTIAFGVMIAYASYKHEESDITKNAIITAIANSAISIISGFAVFSTLGYMAYKNGVAVEELAASGPTLAFIIFPKALSLLPWAPVFAVMFFLMLLTLGIDSAFSLVEAISTVVHDKYPHVRKQDISVYVCLAGFVCGLIFTTFAGLYYLDITDHFITTYGLVGVGLLEVIVVGWIYGPEKLRTYINSVSEIKIGKWWSVFIAAVIPVILILLLTFSFYNDITKPYEGYDTWALWVFGWGMLICLFAVSGLFSLLSKHEKHEKEIKPDTAVID